MSHFLSWTDKHGWSWYIVSARYFHFGIQFSWGMGFFRLCDWFCFTGVKKVISWERSVVVCFWFVWKPVHLAGKWSSAAAWCQWGGAFIWQLGKKQIAGAGDEWEAEGAESELRQKVCHRIIELLQLEEISESKCQPVPPDVTAHHHLTAESPSRAFSKYHSGGSLEGRN